MYQRLQSRLKLAHHRHSGRLLPREHTSNGALLVITLAGGVMLIFATLGLVASADTLQQQGSLQLTATVPSAPPSQAAVILQPTEGQVFTSSPIDVSGTCQSGTFIEIYKNDILGGSTSCTGGQFGLQLDLLIGPNALKARTVDNLQQYGPDSAIVNVTYNPPSPPAGTVPTPVEPGQPASTVPVSQPAPQLIIYDLASYFGVTAHGPYKLTLNIYGGVPPYAVNVEWGDGSSDVVSRSAAGKFTLEHTYGSAKIYYLNIHATDSVGNKASAQTVLLVSGPLPPAVKPLIGTPVHWTIAVIWPLYAAVLIAVSTFWLGEKYEKQRIKELWKSRRRT